ncbi:MAG: MFS transporter [Leptospirales bacterium]
MSKIGIDTNIPLRLDRLPWSRWHLVVVMALGVTWILDGLEVTLVGAVGGELRQDRLLSLSDFDIGLAGTFYLFGAVLGALLFGELADRFGRKRLFTVTLGLYLGATVCTAFSWNFAIFLLFRFLTGAGIGGEYSAINSAVDELVPARFRGRISLAINGSYWIGTAFAALMTASFVHAHIGRLNLNWRLPFLLGGLLGLVVLFVRRFLPESPRWLISRGRIQEAEKVVAGIESLIQRQQSIVLDPVGKTISVGSHEWTGWWEIAGFFLWKYPRRTLLCISLMIPQAFLYNAFFFTYALILTDFFHAGTREVVLFLVPFSLSNVLGVLLLGPLFDRIGRKFMIVFTYTLSGILLSCTGLVFFTGAFSAGWLEVAWCLVFFFASPAASSAYLTISEIVPLEMRAKAIGFFFAVGTAIGGMGAPVLFGEMIGTHARGNLLLGYLLGSVLMIGGAFSESLWGVAAERKSLEEIAAEILPAPARSIDQDSA